MLGMRRGRLRVVDLVLVGLTCCALVLVSGVPGVVLAGLVGLGSLRRWPPRYAALVVTAEDLSHKLWLDDSRVVLGRPYRVLYRDELLAADFARLRRLCAGLPE